MRSILQFAFWSFCRPNTWCSFVQVFDGDHDRAISIADVHRVVGEGFEELRVYRGREGALTFSPPLGYSQDVWADRRQSVLGQVYSFFEHFALGAIAGGIGASAVYPIDLVKTRLQNQRRYWFRIRHIQTLGHSMLC